VWQRIRVIVDELRMLAFDEALGVVYGSNAYRILAGGYLVRYHGLRDGLLGARRHGVVVGGGLLSRRSRRAT
jgi:hypothetical protein